ncbi:MAG: hypothetical protein EBU26_18770, partial [Verrucomicrobia bacterium]|nr:hypothetical protein [Verrucomicrobiota bacterium]
VPMGGNGNDAGILVFQGQPIQEFAIGGQELWIDRICVLTDGPGEPNESDCEVVLYAAHDDGPLPSGGSPDPIASGWGYPSSQAEMSRFVADLSSRGMQTETITFEHDNGWSPLLGLGDMFMGSSAPYTGGTYTSAAYGYSGSMGSGDAGGSVDYNGVDNVVSFSLFSNGHAAGLDEPGLGDMDGSNDADRGVNTSSQGYHFIEALPSERSEGGLTIGFATPVPAVGMYVGGIEESKRDILVSIAFADGSVEDRNSDLSKGPYDVGGMQFLGYLVSDIKQTDCYIKSITFTELYSSSDDPSLRDIFSVDDVIYVASAANPKLNVSNQPVGGDPNGGDPNGGDPNGGDPNGGDPNGGGNMVDCVEFEELNL